MQLLGILLALNALLAAVSCQTSRTRSKTNSGEARTLGLFSPLLGLAGIRRPTRIGGALQSATTASGVASDPIYGGAYGSNYGSNYGNNYGLYPNLLGAYLNQGYGGYPSLGYGGAYRPTVNYGYPNIYNAGAASYYPNNNPFALGNLGGLGTYQAPSNYYGNANNAYSGYNGYSGYQQPSYYGGTGNIGLLSNAVTTNANTPLSAAGSVGGGGAASSTQQQAQLAALLGQALGSSLRPLLAGGAAGGNAVVGGGSGASAGSLGGLLSLLG